MDNEDGQKGKMKKKIRQSIIDTVGTKIVGPVIDSTIETKVDILLHRIRKKAQQIDKEISEKK
jgi:hypothetical protein